LVPASEAILPRLPTIFGVIESHVHFSKNSAQARSRHAAAFAGSSDQLNAGRSKILCSIRQAQLLSVFRIISKRAKRS
jgi:hypothetical protein